MEFKLWNWVPQESNNAGQQVPNLPIDDIPIDDI